MSTCVKENYVLAMQTQKYILPINNLVTTCAFTLCGVYKGVTINVTNKLCNLIHLWYQLIRGEMILSINHLPSSNWSVWLLIIWYYMSYNHFLLRLECYFCRRIIQTPRSLHLLNEFAIVPCSYCFMYCKYSFYSPKMMIKCCIACKK